MELADRVGEVGYSKTNLERIAHQGYLTFSIHIRAQFLP